MAPERRPPRPAGLLDALRAKVPARAAKRVTENPALAEAWTWDAGPPVTVRTDDVVVTLPVDGPPACTCLLAPSCVHVLAVVTALPEAAAAPVEAAPVALVPTSAAQATVSADTWAALTRLCALGAHGADAVTRSDLARLAYDARQEGLHRLGRALASVVRHLRLLAAHHPSFVLTELTADLAEALRTARALRGGTAEAGWFGVARREYRPVGTLRLFGLCAEPVVGRGNGVVSWLVDAKGRRWTVPDLRPRPAGQVPGLYDVAAPLVTLSHRQLTRAGLFVQDAVATEDGRLGTGGGAAAVRAAGATWEQEPLASLWASGSAPPSAGGPDGLVFLSGEILGVWRDALVVQGPTGPFAVVVGAALGALPWRDNLSLLGRCPGLPVRLVGRRLPDRPRTVVGLALAGPDLPADWGGRANLGLDRLDTRMLHARAATPVRVDPGALGSGDGALGVDRPDPLAALRRRVDRAALGGRASFPAGARTAMEREAAALRAAAMPSAARVLQALPDGAEGWLAAAVYLEAATRAWVDGGW